MKERCGNYGEAATRGGFEGVNHAVGDEMGDLRLARRPNIIRDINSPGEKNDNTEVNEEFSTCGNI